MLSKLSGFSKPSISQWAKQMDKPQPASYAVETTARSLCLVPGFVIFVGGCRILCAGQRSTLIFTHGGPTPRLYVGKQICGRVILGCLLKHIRADQDFFDQTFSLENRTERQILNWAERDLTLDLPCHSYVPDPQTICYAG